MYCTTLYFTVLHSTYHRPVLYCTVLYCSTTMYCTVRYYWDSGKTVRHALPVLVQFENWITDRRPRLPAIDTSQSQCKSWSALTTCSLYHVRQSAIACRRHMRLSDHISHTTLFVDGCTVKRLLCDLLWRQICILFIGCKNDDLYMVLYRLCRNIVGIFISLNMLWM